MRIERFEDIQAWQEARKLTQCIYRLSMQSRFKSDFSLSDQIRRAAVSVMANIAEGFGRQGTIEFQRFLSIARSSAVEVQSHLYVALDLSYVSQNDFDEAFQLASSCIRLIGGFLNYLSSQKDSK